MRREENDELNRFASSNAIVFEKCLYVDTARRQNTKLFNNETLINVRTQFAFMDTL